MARGLMCDGEVEGMGGVCATPRQVGQLLWTILSDAVSSVGEICASCTRADARRRAVASEDEARLLDSELRDEEHHGDMHDEEHHEDVHDEEHHEDVHGEEHHGEDPIDRSACDLGYLECRANAPDYQKSDTKRQFLLWELEHPGIEITACDGVRDTHPWLWTLFILRGAGEIQPPRVRFPWNNDDSQVAQSLSWWTVTPGDGVTVVAPTHTVDRYSTASRSCFALVPQGPPHAVDGEPRSDWDTPQNRKADEATKLAVDQPADRFGASVGPALGAFCSSEGGQLVADGPKSRLYSIKTGVTYVGKMDEAIHGKNLLEKNAKLAIIRSEVIRTLGSTYEAGGVDSSFRIQTELLTVTAPCTINDQATRDGFQVRDLSCLRGDENYLPGQAIPYSKANFFQGRDLGAAFWVSNFAKSCGAAKAKLLLKYGLIHTSANAQNFILAFRQGTNEFRAMILRDIGDTSWHDRYVQTVLVLLDPAHAALTRGFSPEQANQGFFPPRPHHLLASTHSPEYPPPFIHRLCAYSTVTHGFADAMIAHWGWNQQEVLSFVQGILDGYVEYMDRALGTNIRADLQARTEAVRLAGGMLADPKPGIQYVGTHLKYPAPRYMLASYQTHLQGQWQNAPAAHAVQGFALSKVLQSLRDETAHFSNLDDAQFLELAATIRTESATILEGDPTSVEWLVNAEEVALCAYFERQILRIPATTAARVGSLPPLRDLT